MDKRVFSFSIKNCKTFQDIPLDIQNQLDYAVYIIDYQWTYLFINKHGEQATGTVATELIGKTALELFKGSPFNTVFAKLEYGVNEKLQIETDIYSPLRDKKVKISGYPLEDCYYFAAVPQIDKQALADDLRKFLRKFTLK
jgi:hypothetical protein